MPIDSLSTGFDNIPPGTALTVGSILFSKLDLPEVSSAPTAAPATNGAGEQLQTERSSRSTAPKGSVGGDAPAGGKGRGNGSGGGAGGAAADASDSFSRIEIRVGRIEKVICFSSRDRLHCRV